MLSTCTHLWCMQSSITFHVQFEMIQFWSSQYDVGTSNKIINSLLSSSEEIVLVVVGSDEVPSNISIHIWCATAYKKTTPVQMERTWENNKSFSRDIRHIRTEFLWFSTQLWASAQASVYFLQFVVSRLFFGMEFLSRGK